MFIHYICQFWYTRYGQSPAFIIGHHHHHRSPPSPSIIAFTITTTLSPSTITIDHNHHHRSSPSPSPPPLNHRSPPSPLPAALSAHSSFGSPAQGREPLSFPSAVRGASLSLIGPMPKSVQNKGASPFPQGASPFPRYYEGWKPAAAGPHWYNDCLDHKSA